MVFSFNQWTESLGSCTPFTYTAKLSSGAALPSFITFTAGSRQFSIESTDRLDAGTYTIEVKGELTGGLSSTTTFVLTVTDPCASGMSIDVANTILPDQVYFTYDSALVISYDAFTLQPNEQCETVSYQAYVNGIDNLETYSFATDVDYTAREITISSSDISDINIYQISIVAWLSSDTSITNSQQFDLQIACKVSKLEKPVSSITT